MSVLFVHPSSVQFKFFKSSQSLFCWFRFPSSLLTFSWLSVLRGTLGAFKCKSPFFWGHPVFSFENPNCKTVPQVLGLWIASDLSSLSCFLQRCSIKHALFYVTCSLLHWYNIYFFFLFRIKVQLIMVYVQNSFERKQPIWNPNV